MSVRASNNGMTPGGAAVLPSERRAGATVLTNQLDSSVFATCGMADPPALVNLLSAISRLRRSHYTVVGRTVIC